MEIIFLVIILVFGFMFASTVMAGFRTTRMVNKVFSLAEQEIDRKLHEATTSQAKTAQSDLDRCEHCGRKVTATESQCPNCGAGLGS